MGIQMGPVWPRARRSQTSVLHTLSYAFKDPGFQGSLAFGGCKMSKNLV